MALTNLTSSALPFSPLDRTKASPFPFDTLNEPPSTVSFVGSRSNPPKILPLRLSALPPKLSHVPSSSHTRFGSTSPLGRPVPPHRRRTDALKGGGWAKTARNSRPRAKKIVLYALVVVAVGTCVVLVALRYVALPEGAIGYVKSAKDWISSKMVLDETTKYVIWDKADTALDMFKTFSGTVVLAWIQLIPLIWLHYHHQRSGLSDPAKKRRPVIQKVSFDDVEGVGGAKEELREIVSCLQGSTSYDKLGAEPPRGTLLVGPPGTGKTLLARAVAGEAGVPFFSASASEFVEVFVGRGAARVRELFKEARKHEPSIVFIDELDAVGGKRGRSFNDEHDQTLVQLLTEMDGFETVSKVIVLAATNRPETLDSALCRPGRFSRKVLVGKPDLEGRKKILSVHLRGVPLEDDSQETCDVVAALTPGFVGADLANVVKEAVLLAARRGAEAVSREDIMKAVERAKFGIENPQQGDDASEENVERNGPYAVSGLYC